MPLDVLVRATQRSRFVQEETVNINELKDMKLVDLRKLPKRREYTTYPSIRKMN